MTVKHTYTEEAFISSDQSICIEITRDDGFKVYSTWWGVQDGSAQVEAWERMRQAEALEQEKANAEATPEVSAEVILEALMKGERVVDSNGHYVKVVAITNIGFECNPRYPLRLYKSIPENENP
jgi:hypothetical protein